MNHTVPADIGGLREEAEKESRALFEAERELLRVAYDGHVVNAWLDLVDERRNARIDAYVAQLCNLDRAASRDHWVRWLVTGEACTRCGGTGEYDDHDTMEHDQRKCVTCLGTGWTRSPFDLRWANDLGQFTPAQSAALLAWSVTSVNRGGDVIARVLGRWQPGSSLEFVRHEVAPRLARLSETPSAAILRWERGWGVGDLNATLGPETGDAGKLAADREALSRDWALLDADGFTLTLPPLLGDPR